MDLECRHIRLPGGSGKQNGFPVYTAQQTHSLELCSNGKYIFMSHAPSKYLTPVLYCVPLGLMKISSVLNGPPAVQRHMSHKGEFTVMLPMVVPCRGLRGNTGESPTTHPHSQTSNTTRQCYSHNIVHLSLFCLTVFQTRVPKNKSNLTHLLLI